MNGSSKGPLVRVILSAGFLGASLVPFAKVCLGC
jgi:hypothetical protein